MGTITVVMPDEDRWFFQELGVGAAGRAAQAGHQVKICRVPLGEDSARRAADCLDEAFSIEDSLGAVAAGFQYRGGSTDRFVAWRRPLVVVGGSVLGFPAVSFDDVGIGRTITKHLLDLGHERVVHLTASLAPEEGFVFMRRRARGYRMTMESAGLTPTTIEADLAGTDLAVTIEEMLTGPDRPTAVFAVYDEAAFAVIEVAERMGLQIGRDLSVAGVNDHPDAERRHLTTTRNRPAEVGAIAIEMILDGLAAGPDSSKSRLHSGTFVRRASTGRLRAA